MLHDDGYEAVGAYKHRDVFLCLPGEDEACDGVAYVVQCGLFIVFFPEGMQLYISALFLVGGILLCYIPVCAFQFFGIVVPHLLFRRIVEVVGSTGEEGVVEQYDAGGRTPVGDERLANDHVSVKLAFYVVQQTPVA